jgi:hypothetical protein
LRRCGQGHDWQQAKQPSKAHRFYDS